MKFFVTITFYVMIGAALGKAADNMSHRFSTTLTLENRMALTFYCTHLINSSRTCELYARIYISGERATFSVSREYLQHNVTKDSSSVYGVDVVASRDRHLSFWLGEHKIAEGDFRRGFGENMSVISRNFIAALRESNFAELEVSENGQITRHHLPYRAELSRCIDLGDAPSDAEFDSMTESHGGRAECSFYEHLGELRVASPVVTLSLIKTEIDYLRTK